MKIIALNPVPTCSWFMFETMTETFERHGHCFVQNPADADIAFFDLHTGGSAFFPYTMQKVLDMGIPVIPFDQFERTNPPPDSEEHFGHETRFDIGKLAMENVPWAYWLSKFLERDQVKLYFVRRMPSKWIKFPSFCRPFDLVLYPDHDFPAVSMDELCRRPVDVCFVGTTGEWRENMVRDLRKTSLKVDLEFVSTRIPHDEWLDRQRQAKLFLSGDGPGDCSDRPYQLICISAMLKFRNFHRLPAPWTHGIDCIEGADEFGRMQADDEGMIRGILDNRDLLYSIYLNGIAHMRFHNTFQARSEYVLREMKQEGLW